MPLAVEVYQRSTPLPYFLIEVTPGGGGRVLHVYADYLSDLMGVLARWMPTVQGAAITGFLENLHSGEMPGLAELARTWTAVTTVPNAHP
ncbi:hypothetical protein [Tenggerimyces flavus]|uniref:Uncharacterized protein n=1 Tax=Tenggerimyces flavus TaxID=1708749 RepID=A0ABV7YAN4_9ACTN|nr:hypothetical protein [Tenggerimyces flavus]MBM7790277.1 hypothetical protein [Tenggerimyces flavus]